MRRDAGRVAGRVGFAAAGQRVAVVDGGAADRQPDPERGKGPGKRWDADNAEAVMAPECLDHSDLWRTYWTTRDGNTG